MMDESDLDNSLTLDPPGSIAVVGAGPLGIEAALYGRYLGYEVTLFEAVGVGGSMLDKRELPLPMLPDRCLSSLALSALQAQDESSRVAGGKSGVNLPMTCGQWIDQVLIPLTQSDLLRGRLLLPANVDRIVLIPVEPEDEHEDTSQIPPDFQLRYKDGENQQLDSKAEAVILATGDRSHPDSLEIEFGFEHPTDYCFQVGRGLTGEPEQQFRDGLRQIVTIFATLMGRSELDLHRPRRN